jgi:RNA polymerase sigma factor (sigma-70 family)
MPSGGSVTNWFEELENGNSVAAQALWERYFPELVRVARDRLRGVRRGISDEEDIALSAMDSFLNAAQKGRFPNLADRDELWRLLIRITARKVVDLKRRETRQRRGGGLVQGESALGRIEHAPEGVPTPEFAAIMAEEYRRLLASLSDPDLETLAVSKMEGYTNAEISEQAGCSVRTVERRLRLIRTKWQQKEPK